METAKDTFPGLFWGYVVIWGLITLYVIYLGVRCSRLEKSQGGKDFNE